MSHLSQKLRGPGNRVPTTRDSSENTIAPCTRRPSKPLRLAKSSSVWSGASSPDSSRNASHIVWETAIVVISLTPTRNRSTKSIRVHAVRVDVKSASDADNSQIGTRLANILPTRNVRHPQVFAKLAGASPAYHVIFGALGLPSPSPGPSGLSLVTGAFPSADRAGARLRRRLSICGDIEINADQCLTGIRYRASTTEVARLRHTTF